MLPPLSPVKMLVVRSPLSLGFFSPFHVPSAPYNLSVLYFVFVFSQNAPFVYRYFLFVSTKNTLVVAVVPAQQFLLLDL